LQESGMLVEGGPLGFLKQEHHTERQLLIDLGAAVTDFRHGQEAAKRRIIEIARNYSHHLLSHIRREDAILFMLAEEMLDEGAKTSLNYAFAKAENNFGDKSVDHYEQLAAELEKAWAV
jgi:hemerythrin-like domain-containing protein